MATVFTPEAVRGSSSGTTGTSVEIYPLAAFLESNLIGDNVLRLELEMTGISVGEGRLEVALRRPGEQGTVASGVIRAPRDLDANQKKRYRIIFPVRDSAKESLEDGDTLEVWGLESKTQGKEVKLEKDDLRSLTNLLALITSGGALLSFLLSWWRKKKQEYLDRPSLIVLAGEVTITLLPFAVVALRLLLLQVVSLSLLETVKVGSVLFVASWAAFAMTRDFQRASLMRAVYSDPPISVEAYEMKVRSGWVAWLTGGAMAVLLGILITFFWLKPDTIQNNASRVQRIALIED